MNKLEMEKELTELITRFKRLKKALQEEDDLTPAQRAAAQIAAQLQRGDKTAVLKKAKEEQEQRRAQQLANQLQKAGILGVRPPPRQPTSEEQRIMTQDMWAQANGFSTQTELEKAEANWGNGFNNWLAEATKPINSRFKSQEEEEAYWRNIKVNDSGRGNEGY